MKMRIFLCLLLVQAALLTAGCSDQNRETLPGEATSLPVETSAMPTGAVEDSVFGPEGDAILQTAPTQAQETAPGTAPPAEPEEQAPADSGSEPTAPPENTAGSDVFEEMDYETFLNSTPSEQQAFMESFDSLEAFFRWFEAAREQYEKENPPVDVGDGNVTIPD